MLRIDFALADKEMHGILGRCTLMKRKTNLVFSDYDLISTTFDIKLEKGNVFTEDRKSIEYI